MRRPHRRGVPKAPKLKILVHVVHYFGPGPAFQGRSTSSPAADRRVKVQRVIDALRVGPFDLEVVVCGMPDAALVPIDLDLSESVHDPRHLVYAAIESLAERVDDGFDYYMCLEDDVLVPSDVIPRMIRFRERARVNEVLLPNRLEQSEDGAAYCIDLTVVPGWRGLSREFEGSRLAVAENPHSGLAFLSRDQLRYASRRVDLGRRDQFLGGPMASAFANLHLAFLLWRTRDDLSAHHVVHLDRWESRGASFSVPGQQLGVQPEQARGMVDEVRFDGVLARVRGWLADQDGNGASPSALRIGDREVRRTTFSTHDRADVSANVPGVSADCGFLASFSLLDLSAAELAQDELSVHAGSIVVRATWPAGAASVARDGAPSIPDDPHMPAAAVKRLRALLTQAGCYLEYGTGGSTLLAGRMGVPLCYSVDSNESWLATLEHRLQEVPTGARHVLTHADIGPTGESGFPQSIPPGTSASDYALAVWERVQHDGARPDLVLIDGRYRVSCFLATLLRGNPGTRVLFDDYLDRPHYAVVEDLVHPLQTHDRLAEFVLPERLDRERAWSLLASYAGDPR